MLYEARPHAATLAPAFARALVAVVAAALGVLLLARSSAPVPVRAAFDLALVAVGARSVVLAVRETWRWDRSVVRLTTRELVVGRPRTRTALRLDRVRGLTVRQGAVGRLLGYGTLVIDDGNRERSISCVSDPDDVGELILEARP